MADFARQIFDSILYQELDRSAGRDGVDRTEVDRLKGLVNEVADTVGPVMAQIPVTFRQYTVHDIRHCRNVIDRMGDILPDGTRGKLNALEVAFLLLSALLHDIGMVVNDQEKAETLVSDNFRRFREEGHSDRSRAIKDARSAGNEPRARAIEDALLAEYYRRLHPERVRQFMDRFLAGRFKYREVDFSDDLARLCESHAWGVEESNDGRYPEKAVSRLDDNVRLYGVRVNLQYLACILRLADILDFDRSRTPLSVFQHLDFTEPKSWEEWNKHLQVKGWDITPTQIAFDIPCTRPAFYVAVNEFLGWIDDELRQCRYLAENKPQATAERYSLTVPQVVDRHKVRMAEPRYIAGAFRFQLEYENILHLLMDKSLYPSPSLFLRELLQNALDACRRKEAEMEVRGYRGIYKPKIVVRVVNGDGGKRKLVFQDNGIGMSLRIVEQYFLRVGRSYYRSPEFDAERQRLREHGKELDACSQFGIGILSCFMVADRLEVETYQEGYEPLHIEVEGPTKYFLVRKLPKPQPDVLYEAHGGDAQDGPPKRSGTRITVHLRDEHEIHIGRTLSTFAVNVDYPILVHDAENSYEIPSLAWEGPFRPKLSKQDRLAGGGPTPRKEAEDLLHGLLVPEPLSFDHLGFRGKVWFWLLRGTDGKPTPQTGSVLIERDFMRLTGIPALISDLDHFYFNRRVDNYLDLIQEFRHIAVDQESKANRLSWELFRLSATDRSRLEDVIVARSRVIDSPLKPWYDDRETIEALVSGSIDWARCPVEFNEPTMDVNNINRGKEQIALNSILLPAGIVQWTPTEGIASRLPLLSWFGGLRLDLRGPLAPRPAAHRLFILDEEAKEFLRQFSLEVLMHAATLAERRGVTNEWRQWFVELATSILRSNPSIRPFVRRHGSHIGNVFGIEWWYALVGGEAPA